MEYNMSLTQEEIKEANLITQSEMRDVVHSIREEVQGIRSLVDLHIVRIDKGERLLSDHIKSCIESKSALDEIKHVLDSIKTGLRVSNVIKDIVVWCACTAVTVTELWKAFH